MAVSAHGGDGGEEALRVGVLGSGEEGVAGAVLDDLAVAHDGNAGGDLADDGQVVGDEEHGERVFALEVGEQGEDLGLYGDVECGGGFIGDEQAGAIDESHGDEDALALSAGELMGVVGVAHGGVGDLDGLERGDGVVAGFAACGGRRVCGVGFGDLAADGHDGIERGHRLLKDHGDLAATDPAQGCRSLQEQIESGAFAGIPEDLAFDAGCGVEEAWDGESGGAFAGAGLADEAEDLAFVEGKAYAANGFRVAEANGEVADVEERRHEAMVADGLDERDGGSTI